MTLDEAKELCNDLARGFVPPRYFYNGSSRTISVRGGGWVHLGESGIRAAVVDTQSYWLPGMAEPIGVSVRVLVGRDWFFLDTEDEE